MWLDRGEHETSTTHVENVCAALELALTRGEGGESYFVIDDGMRTIRELFTQLPTTQGLTLADKSVPGTVAMLSSTVTVNNRKARGALGHRPEISDAEGMAALAQRAPRSCGSAEIP